MMAFLLNKKTKREKIFSNKRDAAEEEEEGDEDDEEEKLSNPCLNNYSVLMINEAQKIDSQNKKILKFNGIE